MTALPLWVLPASSQKAMRTTGEARAREAGKEEEGRKGEEEGEKEEKEEEKEEDNEREEEEEGEKGQVAKLRPRSGLE